MLGREVGRSIRGDERDKFKAATWPGKNGKPMVVGEDGAPREQNWGEATKDYFGFDDVAKELYRKLEIESAEHID